MKKNSSQLLKKHRKSPFSNTSGLLKFFIIFFLCSLFVCAVMAAVSGGDSWKKMLFHNGHATDLFMDFFNSLRDAGAKDVYTARNNIYPPLCLLVFKILGYLIPDALIDLPNKQRTMLQLDESCMMVYFIFAVICILSMTTIINAYVNKLNWKNNRDGKTYHQILSFLMIISYPVMYCIERGNIIILSMIFTMFFVFFRDSENAIIKELSYISLALAAGIKLYPAVFGILLLLEKKYKDAFRLIAYGIICVVVPFIFFIDFDSKTLSVPILTAAINSNRNLVIGLGGSESPLANIIENLLSFATKKKSRLNFSSVSIQNFIFIFDADNSTLAKIVCYITEAIAFVALFFTKKKWQQIFLVSYLMLNIPSASSSYALTFLLIPFIMFLYDDQGNGYAYDKRPKIDRSYIVYFALLLTPLPIVWYFHQVEAAAIFNSLGMSYQSKINQVVAGFVFQFMFFQIIIESLVYTLKNRKSKQTVAVSNSEIDTTPVADNCETEKTSESTDDIVEENSVNNNREES